MSYTCYNWNWDEVGYLSKRGNGSSDVSYIAIGIAIGIALGVALESGQGDRCFTTYSDCPVLSPMISQ